MNITTEVMSPPKDRRFSPGGFLRATFIEGGRFWERGRLAYNGAQLALTLVILLIRPRDVHFFLDNLVGYLAFAVIANILYSAVYLPEAVLQLPLLRPYARPVRWCILIAGTAIACFLADIAMGLSILRDPAED